MSEKALEICEKNGWPIPYDGFDQFLPEVDKEFKRLLIYRDSFSNYITSRNNIKLSQLAKEFGPGTYILKYMNNNGFKIDFNVSEEFAKESGYVKPVPETIEANIPLSGIPQMQQNYQDPNNFQFSMMQQSRQDMMDLMKLLLPVLAGNNNGGVDVEKMMAMFSTGQSVGVTSSKDYTELLSKENARLKRDVDQLTLQVRDLNEEILELKRNGHLSDDEIEELNPGSDDPLDKLVSILGTFMSNGSTATVTPEEQKAKVEEMSVNDQIKNLLLGGFDNQGEYGIEDIAVGLNSILSTNSMLHNMFNQFDVKKVVEFVYPQLGREDDGLSDYVTKIVKHLKGETK
jgi:hypothetical protein